MTRLLAPLVLASASPRRRDILELLGLSFRVLPVEVDESRSAGEAPDLYVVRVAEAKAVAAIRCLGEEAPAPFVLAADTAVVLGDRVLGKPRDDRDAVAMIMSLSGRSHHVVTGVAVARAEGGLLAGEAVSAVVRFRQLDEGMAARYVASGEGRDKAGSYAVQGLGAGLVSAVEGPYHTVVGLPATQTLALLQRVGALSEWP